MLDSAVPGRIDKLPISVKAGSYIIPADILSGIGQGNSLAGRKVLDHVIAQHAHLFPPLGGSLPDVPIIAAGGEYVVPPEAVHAIGGGDLEAGHDALDRFVLKTRRELRKKLAGLPAPKTD